MVVAPNETGTSLVSLSTPSTICFTLTVSPCTSCLWFNWLLFNPLGSVTLQVPSLPTVTSLSSVPDTFTLTFAFGSPVPVNSLSVEDTVGIRIFPFG